MSEDPSGLVPGGGQSARRSPRVIWAMTDRTPQAQRAIDLLDGRWTLPILATLVQGGRRYQNLHDALDGISYKVLTETLRRSERDGLIARHLDPGRVETATLYELTDLGRSLDVLLSAVAEWADVNWQSVEAARQHWDRLRRASG
jgi:DNA-binding HxlR family transcriptional regulator